MKPLHIKYKTFNGDFFALANFLNYTWDQSFGKNHVNFTEEYLKLIFQTPDTLSELLIGCYHGDKLVGFVGSVIRNVICEKRQCIASEILFLSVSPEYSGKSIVFGLFWKLEKIIATINLKIDIFLGYTRNELSNFYSVWSEGKIIFKSELPKSCLYLRNSLKSPDNSFTLELYNENDLDDCLKIANMLSSKVTLGAYWTKDVLRHYLLFEDLTVTYVYKEEDRVCAFINLLIAEMRDRKRTKHAFILNLCINKLSYEGQRRFLTAVKKKVKALDVECITTYNTTYLSSGVLEKVGFKEIGETFTFVLESLSGKLPEKISKASFKGLTLPIV